MKRKDWVALSLAIVIIGAAAYAITRNSPGQTGTWQLSNQISGAGYYDTAEFTMSNQWRVVWSIEHRTSALFVVAVYVKNGDKYSPVAEADATDINATQGILQVDYTGSFVIRVDTLSDTGWSLRIEEFVKPT